MEQLLASLVTGGLVVATLLVLAPLFSGLPAAAVLGAVIIDAVVFGMIDVAELRRLYRVTRLNFSVAAAVFGVRSVGVLSADAFAADPTLILCWRRRRLTPSPIPMGRARTPLEIGEYLHADT